MLKCSIAGVLIRGVSHKHQAAGCRCCSLHVLEMLAPSRIKMFCESLSVGTADRPVSHASHSLPTLCLCSFLHLKGLCRKKSFLDAHVISSCLDFWLTKRPSSHRIRSSKLVTFGNILLGGHFPHLIGSSSLRKGAVRYKLKKKL